MDDVLKINSYTAEDIRNHAEDITEADSEVTLFKFEQQVETFGVVGYVEYNQITEHEDSRLYVIREGRQYYASSYIVGRDNTPNGWADTTEEDGETFVVFVPVGIKYRTRIDWLRDD